MIHHDQPRPDLRLPETVKASWDRSRRYGISPSDALVLNEVSRAHLQRVRERNERLAAYVAPELSALHRTLGGAGWMLACLDEEGTIASTFGKAPSARLEQVLRTGVSLSELAIGTNGPGCAIAERKPMVVSGCEHYLQEAQDFTCVAVPVFDPAGELVGVIDASSSHRNSCGDGAIVLDGLQLAAHAIEKRMLADMRGAILVRIHPRQDMLGTPLEGLLALSDDGRLLGMNGTARQLLALRNGVGAGAGAGAGGGMAGGQPRWVAPVSRAVGSPGLDALAFASLFDAPFHQTMDRLRAARHAPVPLRSAGGVLLYARAGLGMDAGPEAPRPFKVSGGVAPARPQAEEPPRQDPGVERVLRDGRRAYARGLPVLVTGETGTGKEVAARMLHDSGPRANGPFIAVNCSAIPASLVESEFFGYVDGAFTGGRSGGAAGKMEQAHGGTLFLDEIGDMPYELQGRLLRVLQERSVTRLGGSRAVGVDIAVVCATHRDLPKLVSEGRFREDLMYRINGFQVRLPALRERSDFSALVQRLLRDACETAMGGGMGGGDGNPVPVVSPPAMAALRAYPWPGNIRQLQHALRVAAMYGEDSGCIDLEHLPVEVRAGAAPPPGVTDDPEELTHFRQNEADFIRGALRATGGNISATAAHIGISRHTLYRKMRLYGIARPGGR